MFDVTSYVIIEYGFVVCYFLYSFIYFYDIVVGRVIYRG